MMRYFDDIEKFLEQNRFEKPVGCSMSEIEELEKKVGFDLPESYKAYLALMGRDYKGIMRGSDCFIDHVIENTEYLSELLQKNNVSYELPKNYLAFFCHQGYIMAWFKLPKENDNPACYFYSEGTTDVPIKHDNFKQFISADIMDNAKIETELKQDKRWWNFWK